MTADPIFDRQAPIGVFDSGLGGLTVVSQILRLLPQEQILFIADQAHVPYGGRDLSEVRGFARGISEGLFGVGCKAIVMACNISSATALHAVHVEHPDALVLGVIEPGGRAAAAMTQNGRIGILATVGTVHSGAYTRTLRALDSQLFVQEVACPDFVPLVENDAMETPDAVRAAQTYLAPILDSGIDTVVLGCTHYPFLLPVLQSVAPHLRFVNPAEQTVIEMAEALDVRCMAARGRERASTCLATTGDAKHFAVQLRRFLPETALPVHFAAARWNAGQLTITTSEPSGYQTTNIHSAAR